MKLKKYFFIVIGISVGIVGCSKDKKTVIEKDWEVESMRVHSDSSLINAPASYVLSFENKKNYSINLDVNNCDGEVVFGKKSKIDFGPAGCSKICCDSYYAGKLVVILESVNKYDVSESSLTLTGDDGVTINLKRK